MAKKKYGSYSKHSGGRKVKGENLNKVMMKDINFLRDLNNVGRMQEHHLKEHNIPASRATKMVWDGYIQKSEDHKGNTCWNITKEGRELLARETGEDVSAYKAQGLNSRYYHDLKLADINATLTREERDSWITETRLREMWNERLEEIKRTDEDEYNRLKELNISPPDGAYIDSSGVIHAVEVISIWYTQEQIDAKIEYCNQMNMEFHGYRC